MKSVTYVLKRGEKVLKTFPLPQHFVLVNPGLYFVPNTRYHDDPSSSKADVVHLIRMWDVYVLHHRLEPSRLSTKYLLMEMGKMKNAIK